ncbi:hypothetical protein QQF64_015755 [Cirrhinus molitorella]|uniref:Uncharacterized protein n=1 Tax=Cirrhinus molitorella TaxID=172907 RepID=A0ABR3NXC9_9TELE
MLLTVISRGQRSGGRVLSAFLRLSADKEPLKGPSPPPGCFPARSAELAPPGLIDFARTYSCSFCTFSIRVSESWST